MERRVVCAAIKNSKDHIVCSARHYDKLMIDAIMIDLKSWKDKDDIEQGFIDQFGVFMTREEAYIVAKENNQIIRRCGGDDGRLFSENLY